MHKYIFFLSLPVLLILGCNENISTPDEAPLLKNSLEKSSKNYTTHLAGRNELPPVSTKATGQAIFRLNKEGTELYFKLIAANIHNVFMAHIHIAPPDANGGIAVWLYPQTPFPVPALVPPDSWIEGRFSGVLSEGVITDADLTGPLAGMTLEDLLGHFNLGNAYVNIHTNDFVEPDHTGPGDLPFGEIRGNISQ